MSRSSGCGPSRPRGRGRASRARRCRRRSVNSRSSRGKSSTSARLAPCSVRTVSRARREVDGDDLAERRRGGEHDRGRVAGDRQAGDVRARRRSTTGRGVATVERDGVQVGAAAVADAEQHGAAVAGELRQSRPGSRARRASRCGRARRRGRPARRRPAERAAGRACPTGSPRPADDEQRRAVRRPRDRAADARRRARRARGVGRRRRDVDDVDRRRGGCRSASGAVAAANASVFPSGDHAGSPACQSPLGHLPALLRARDRGRGGACASCAGSPAPSAW